MWIFHSVHINPFIFNYYIKIRLIYISISEFIKKKITPFDFYDGNIMWMSLCVRLTFEWRARYEATYTLFFAFGKMEKKMEIILVFCLDASIKFSGWPNEILTRETRKPPAATHQWWCGRKLAKKIVYFISADPFRIFFGPHFVKKNIQYWKGYYLWVKIRDSY